MSSCPLSTEEILASMREDDEIAAALANSAHTHYVAYHLPSGSAQQHVVSPASVRSLIGPFDAKMLPACWSEQRLQALLSRWNRQVPCTWRYEAATAATAQPSLSL